MARLDMSFDCGLSPQSLAVGAYWEDNRLVHVEPVRPKKVPMAERLTTIFGEFAKLGQVDRVVLEIMQVYTRDKSKGDPNDLINLALLGGMILTLSKEAPVLFKPHEWNHGFDKETTKRRLDRYFEERPDELKVFRAGLARVKAESLHHNIYDGVAIGMASFGAYSIKPQAGAQPLRLNTSSKQKRKAAK